MSTRESRRRKEKRTMIPFGDIMLPVIGLVAVGLLIVGVKLFFLTEPKVPGYTAVVPSASPVRVEVQTPPPVTAPAKPQISDQQNAVLAAPVGGTGTQTKHQPARPSAPAQAKPAPQKPRQSAPQPKAQTQAPARSKWGVQIGSFGAREGAETVRQQASKAGYSSAISSAVVGGKTFYRVTVPAGNDRAGAENLAGRLKSSGFPVLVVGLE
ncbi:MAG: SPOR domain-containing protein [Aminivibrio sp.]|jgi:cell division protein FtsN